MFFRNNYYYFGLLITTWVHVQKHQYRWDISELLREFKILMAAYCFKYKIYYGNLFNRLFTRPLWTINGQWWTRTRCATSITDQSCECPFLCNGYWKSAGMQIQFFLITLKFQNYLVNLTITVGFTITGVHRNSKLTVESIQIL